MNVHRKNSINESKGKTEQKFEFDVVYGTIFRISSVFKEASKTSLELDRLKLSKPLAHEQKVLI
jgi:hypothetical protein